LGVLAAVIWTAPSVISLTASLYGVLASDAPDEYESMLAIVGAFGMGFAIGSYAIASALDRIAIGLWLAVTEQLVRTTLPIRARDPPVVAEARASAVDLLLDPNKR
jgi:hypothetical protein